MTVVIPVYNAQLTIERCLNSVLNQTYEEVEIIVVDDSSQDLSWEKIQDIAKFNSGKRIRCLQNSSNSGPGYSRNRGIDVAKGHWITFLDSDDEWHHEHIDRHIKTILENGNDKNKVVFSSHPTTDSSTLAPKFRSNGVKMRNLSLFRMIFFQTGYHTISTFIPRSILTDSIRFPVARNYGEDLEFFWEVRLVIDKWIEIEGMNTAYLKKHPFASASGLSSHHSKMLEGIIEAVRNSLRSGPNSWIIPIAVNWHRLKHLRRMYLVKRIAK